MITDDSQVFPFLSNVVNIILNGSRRYKIEMNNRLRRDIFKYPESKYSYPLPMQPTMPGDKKVPTAISLSFSVFSLPLFFAS